jgi:hypothetical protein
LGTFLAALESECNSNGGIIWICVVKKINLRVVYASLLQLEYVLALVTGVLLGAEKWTFFITCLVLTCALGFVTTSLYWRIFDRGVTHGKSRTD